MTHWSSEAFRPKDVTAISTTKDSWVDAPRELQNVLFIRLSGWIFRGTLNSSASSFGLAFSFQVASERQGL